MAKRQQQKQVELLRFSRKLHRLSGISLFVFFFIVAVTGLLLGWKKNSAGLILADTQKGSSSDLSEWLSMAELRDRAQTYLLDSVSTELSSAIDRIDVRPGKGIVKFTFKDHYWGLQIDGATGALLMIERRRSDFIEHIHDGSIVDDWLGLSSGQFKLFYTSVMGLALIIFTVTGFWLWYGPKRIRAAKRR